MIVTLPKFVAGVASAGLVAGVITTAAVLPAQATTYNEIQFYATDSNGDPITHSRLWQVPAGVSSILVDANGAGGGCPVFSANGGAGVNVVAPVPVPASASLEISVGVMGGQNSGPTSAGGGWPNGGKAGGSSSSGGAGGGGGATQIVTATNNDRLFVAAGGGGCSYYGLSDNASGGNAGALVNGISGANGEDGQAVGGTDLTGGGGATTSGVGTGGLVDGAGSPGDAGGSSGSGGAGGLGSNGSGGGGGGGGYYGGGGGGSNNAAGSAASGGAGSSYVPPSSLPATTFTQLPGAAQGGMTITWIGINTTSLAAGSMGTPYSQTLNAIADRDNEDFAWNVIAGALPEGLSITTNPSTHTTAITGTPQVSGAYPVTLQATRPGTGMTSQRSYTIDINGSAPSVQTGAATAGSTSATLSGTINPNGAATTATFSYGTSPFMANATTVPASNSPVAPGAVTTVNATIGSLSPGTTYYYRASANNGFGGTINGDIGTFTTSQATQAPLGCGALPTKIKKSKPTVLLPRKCLTNAGQALQVSIKAKHGKKSIKAELVTKHGKVTLLPNKKATNYTVTFKAPATTSYLLYTQSKTYRV